MVERIINITVEDVCEHYTWKVVAASEKEMADKISSLEALDYPTLDQVERRLTRLFSSYEPVDSILNINCSTTADDYEVIEITPKEMKELIENWNFWREKVPFADSVDYDVIPDNAPCKRMQNCYWCEEEIDGKRWYTGCDNRAGYCWVADFSEKKTCIDWLYDECDSLGDYE